jgi:cytochrome c553
MNRVAILTAWLTAIATASQAAEVAGPSVTEASEPGARVAVAAADPHADRFRRDVAPLLTRACGSCHDPDTQEGGVVLTTLDGSMHEPATVALWRKARRLVTSRTMPPAAAAPLADGEIEALTSWIDEGFSLEAERLRMATSRLVTRRLTNREFNRSLVHLVGAASSRRDFTAEENIPADAVDPTGFSNDARTNPLTKTHLEAFKQAAIAALREFAPFVEQSRGPLRYFYHGEHCHTSRATQDHVFDFVKNVPHPMTEAEFRTRREIEGLTGNSFLNRPMNKAVFGPALYPFKPGELKNFDNDLLLANAVAFPASQMYSRGTFHFRLRVRGKPGADGILPLLRVKVGCFDVFANHFHTLAEVRLSTAEQVLEFSGNVRDFPYLDNIPPERTFRDGNVPKLTAFSTNDWYDCMAGFFIVLVENAGRHDEGLPLEPGQHRYALGNIHIGSYDEIYERARAKTLPNYYMKDSELVEVFRKNQEALAGRAPAIEIDWAELTLEDVPAESAVFFASPHRGPTDAYAAEVIGRFVDAAFRGFATADDRRTFTDLYAALRKEGLAFEPAVHEALAAVLVSPKHLFLDDFAQPATAGSHALLLAARLAFWLWGEPPDEKLLAAGADGTLLDPAVLRAEAARLLADPRAGRFVDRFIDEAWHLDRFDQVAIDKGRYPFYDEELEAEIKEQFRRTVHGALGLDGPADVRSLIDADHLWLTPRLAQLIRTEGYAGTGEFVNVKLPETSPLGGVLTQPRIMKMNSDGADSHPVRRGTWVLERILFDPPPPPPKVTPLEEQGIIRAASLRERIAEHARSGGSCIACHRRIDPFGLAFENFDAAGGWRDAVPAGDAQQPVTIESTLADGTVIASLADLKRFILERRLDAFTRGFVEGVVQYAAGRRLDLADERSVELAQRAFIDAGYDFRTLVQAVAASASFTGLPE